MKLFWSQQGLCSMYQSLMTIELPSGHHRHGAIFIVGIVSICFLDPSLVRLRASRLWAEDLLLTQVSWHNWIWESHQTKVHDIHSGQSRADGHGQINMSPGEITSQADSLDSVRLHRERRVHWDTAERGESCNLSDNSMTGGTVWGGSRTCSGCFNCRANDIGLMTVQNKPSVTDWLTPEPGTSQKPGQ